MASSKQHFGSHIFRTSAKRVGNVLVLHALFGKTEICDSNMAVGVKQYVFRFDVPVNNFFFVEVLHPQANLDKVEPGLFFGHFADLSEQKEELSS